MHFVHLHLHSEYSMVDGIVRIKPLMDYCKQMNSPAIAVTDLCNLFAAVKTYQAALNKGLKPILGAELTLFEADSDVPCSQAVFLCQNNKGYQNLTELISRGYQEGQSDGAVRVNRAWLAAHNDGLIVLSGAVFGDVGQALVKQDVTLARARLKHWVELFPDRFYIELTRTNRPHEEAYIQAVLPLAHEFDLPVVASNDVRFIAKHDFEAHETRVCIHDGYLLEDNKRPKKYSEEQYLKTPEEMAALFEELPEAIANTVEIAKRCNATLALGKNYLPDFPVPAGMTIGDFLRQQSELGLAKRLSLLLKDCPPEVDQKRRQLYEQRLQTELDVINTMGFPGYFLIVADFIQWAKKNDVPVGPGRGSGAGSLVAYALEITDLDPLAYDLLFERFLNPERVSMPDFDVDFCMEGRDRVIEYVAQKYGRQSVSQIITFGSMTAKAVVRDVGRVLGHPYGFVDKIAKLIPFEIGMTLTKALEQEEALQARYQAESDVFELLELAKKLEGITRNAGKHAGGVVIAPSKLTDFTAIYCEPGSSQLVTQFDKDDVEAAGLVKFDFLGLRTLTIIHWALQSVKATLNEDVDISLIPLEDEATFKLLKACQTTAVFQLESRGMKDLIHRLQPDCFEDIIALVALFRPGPLQSGMVDDFIDRKHGRAKVEYPHPDLEPILKPTYGVILYQEQVMQIAQVLAGYSLGAADLLRRAMGKKKPEEMAKQRQIFTKGAVERGVEESTATYIFDLMEKFAGYGFNKSHSAAYALVAYQTAWLKAHFPAQFMAAVLSSDMDNTDKVVNFIDECRHMGITILPPDINQSEHPFRATRDGQIRYGLGAIKGVGSSAIESICHNRLKVGHFDSLFHMCREVDLRKVNRRVMEALIKAGALDGFKVSRATLIASIEQAMKLGERNQSNQHLGQHDLFEQEQDEILYTEAAAWSLRQALEGERETLGLYFSGHPVDQYQFEVNAFASAKLRALNPSIKKNVVVLGLVAAVRRVITKRGKKMAIITLDDNTARIEVAFFQEVLELYESLLEKDNILVLEGEISLDDYTGGLKMSAKKAMTVDEARNHFFSALHLTLTQDDALKLNDLQLVFEQSPGDLPVAIHYQHKQIHAMVHLSTNFSVNLTEHCLTSFRHLLGNEAVKLIAKQ